MQHLNAEGLCASRVSAYTASASNGMLTVLAATEAYSQLLTGDAIGSLPPDVQAVITRTLADKAGHHDPRHYAGYFCTESGSESVIYMTFHDPINDEARELLDIFSRNMSMAYECLLLRESTKNVQRAALESWTDPLGSAA